MKPIKCRLHIVSNRDRWNRDQSTPCPPRPCREEIPIPTDVYSIWPDPFGSDDKQRDVERVLAARTDTHVDAVAHEY
jgi:hypothetical protein